MLLLRSGPCVCVLRAQGTAAATSCGKPDTHNACAGTARGSPDQHHLARAHLICWSRDDDPLRAAFLNGHRLCARRKCTQNNSTLAPKNVLIPAPKRNGIAACRTDHWCTPAQRYAVLGVGVNQRSQAPETGFWSLGKLNHIPAAVRCCHTS